jgi:hypothetical protein
VDTQDEARARADGLRAGQEYLKDDPDNEYDPGSAAASAADDVQRIARMRGNRPPFIGEDEYNAWTEGFVEGATPPSEPAKN